MPAAQRRRADFLLGEERHRLDRAENGNVEPGHVVGDDQPARGVVRAAVNPHAHAAAPRTAGDGKAPAFDAPRASGAIGRSGAAARRPAETVAADRQCRARDADSSWRGGTANDGACGSREVLSHDERGRRLAVGPAIIAFAPAHFDESRSAHRARSRRRWRRRLRETSRARPKASRATGVRATRSRPTPRPRQARSTAIVKISASSAASREIAKPRMRPVAGSSAAEPRVEALASKVGEFSGRPGVREGAPVNGGAFLGSIDAQGADGRGRRATKSENHGAAPDQPSTRAIASPVVGFASGGFT